MGRRGNAGLRRGGVGGDYDCGAGEMRMYQINEDDLVTLEREMPAVFDRLMQHLDSPLKVKARVIQNVLSRVRWNYGPPDEVMVIPCEPAE